MMLAMPLQSSVLVLNKSFAPVNLVTVQRAFGMLFAESAQVVLIERGQVGLYDLDGWLEASHLRLLHKPEEDHQEWVCTVSLSVEVPRIVRVLSYDRYPQSRVSLSRRNILARDEHRCQYCGRTFSPPELSVDHVVPLSRGGSTHWANVVCACRRCNRMKGGLTPQEAGMKLLRRPTEPRFDPLVRLKLRHEKYHSWRAFFSDTQLPAVAEYS
jgi:5-methylcytosine-specific restriction endonuclease McrA